MRAVLQRVSEASVTVEGEVVGRIGHGLLALVGIAAGDAECDAVYVADKIADLRLFEDEQGRMNRSLSDTGGGVLVISQFTLLGDCRKGRRPSWSEAAPHEIAEPLYFSVIKRLQDRGIYTQQGVFRATMAVSLTNEGPVTVLLDSRRAP